MEGVKIELKDRRGQKMNVRRREHEEERYFYKDGCRYSFHFDKPNKKQIKDTVLKIKNLELPKDIETFNSGTSLDRWTKKRPRLKSSISQRKPRIIESSDDEDHLDIIPEENYLRDDDFYEEQDDNTFDIDEKAQNDDIYEIDSNVQKLIEEAANFKDVEDDSLDRKRFRRRLKEEKRLRRKGKRKISIVLSKPPSPQTERVIRVDVTSNYSFENAESSEDDDYCERFQNIVDEKEEDEAEQDFTVMCRKLTISARERKIESKIQDKSA